MNQELFRLAAQGIKRKRKSSLLLFAVLCLSFAFAIVTLSSSGSMKRTNEEYRLDTFGTWQGAVPDGLTQDEKFLREQEWLSELGIIKSVGDLSSDKAMEAFGTVDETLLSMGRLGLQDGRWPEKKNEIVVEAAALSALGFDYTLGQEITVQTTLPTRPAQGELSGPGVTVEHTFLLCGVLREYSSLWKSSLAGWQGEMPAALMTEETVALLRQEAELEADRMEENAQAAIDEARLTGQEPDPALYELLDLTLEDPTPRYFFTAQEGTESEMKTAVNDYLDTFTQGKPRGKIQKNTLAYGDNGEEKINIFYAGLLFGVTVLAVLCIYAIQLQKQVRQYTLFRSIGIKRSQLRLLVSFETLLLCVPAVALGAAFGVAGTGAVLKLAVYSGSAPIQVSIPWGLLWPLMLAWFLGIVLARLVILQLALHAPLTGRIVMENKRARRVRRARKALIAALSAFLCGAVVFTALEAFRPLADMRILVRGDYMVFKKFTYSIEDETAGGKSAITFDKNAITDSFVKVTEQVPGVSQVRANAHLYAELLFDGMEQVEFYQNSRNRKREMYEEASALDYSPNALAVKIIAYREGDLENHLDFEKLGIDPEAFRRGEQVIVSLCSSYDREFHPDGGVETGDTIDLNIYGYRPGTRQGRYGCDVDFRTLWSFSPKAVVLHSVPKGCEPYFTESEYAIYCSYGYLNSVFDQMEENFQNGAHLTSEELAYNELEIDANLSASYLSTDKVIAQLCGEQEYSLFSYREENAAIKQNSLQTLLLLFSGGGCVIVVLLLLLSNAQTMETEREKKKYGVLQALGMSKKQVRRSILTDGLFKGAFGVAVGWLLFGVFLLVDAPRVLQAQLDYAEQNSQFGVMPACTNYWEAFWYSIENLQYGGVNVMTVLILTAAGITLVAALSFFAKRPLLRGGPMEKLRDEQ